MYSGMRSATASPMREKIEQGIYKLEPKKYEIRGDAGFKSDGSRGQFKRVIHGTLQDARMERARMYRSPKVAQDSSITLDAFWDRFCELMSKTVDPITLDTYKKQYRIYIEKHLGARQLKRINVRDCEQCIYAAPSPAMQKKVHALLRLIFNKAIAWKDASTSPITDVPTPKVPSRRTKRKCNTTEELQEIMKLIEDEWFAPAIYIMVGSGARVSEACGLNGSKIDRKTRLITNDTVYKHVGKGKYELSEHSKTDDSSRIVKVSQEILDVLPDKEGPVVVWRGQRANGRQVRDAYRKFMNSHKQIEYFPLKNFRHAFATEMLKGGASTADVAYAMGHTNSYITDTYFDLVREAGRVNSDVVGDRVFRKSVSKMGRTLK